jgi:hypothetical protein
MSSYDPLSTAQIALLREVEAAPVILKIGGADNFPRWKDMQYLHMAGFVENEVNHTSQEPNQSTMKYTRTDKSL